MNKYLLLAGLAFLQACAQKPYYGDLEYKGTFPSRLSEVSGIDQDAEGNLWVIEDNGNADKIYLIDSTASVIKELKIEDAKNEDWEDLTISKDGTLYIGDFGNNNNSRKDLVIYKILASQLKKKTPKAEKIKFYYPEQKKFPPETSSLLFDSEGFFHWDGFLYVFTKNRSRPYNGKTLIYRIPDSVGNHRAEFLGSMVLCKDRGHCSVTGADISEDGKTIALTGYGYLYFLKDFTFDFLPKAKLDTTYLKHETQIESICFSNDTTLFIADEQSKTKGRNLYKYILKKH